MTIHALPSGPFQNLIVERRGEKQNVGLITLNRPKALNALCDALMREMETVLNDFSADSSISTVVLTGSQKAFAGTLPNYPIS